MSADSISFDEPSSEVLAVWAMQAVRAIRSTGRRGLALTLIGGAVGVTIALLVPARFTSACSFIAQGTGTSLPISMLPTALQGIAGGLGLGTGKEYSPQFYADLLTSDPVLSAVIHRRYAVADSPTGQPQTYIEIQSYDSKPPLEADEAAMRELRRWTAARADVRTNIVSLSVTSRTPNLSRDLATAMIDALDSLNVAFRQQQSHELREYFQGRVDDAQRGLDSAETALRTFLERNRSTENSPLLKFEQTQLTRRADLKQAVYTTVVQQYEEAKLQEARNVPVLTVLAAPNIPAKKSGPPRRLIVLTGFLIGLLTALGIGWTREVFQRARLAESR
jgi:uncharacterized protein involved in exopolysaccharide biosynthesis